MYTQIKNIEDAKEFLANKRVTQLHGTRFLYRVMDSINDSIKSFEDSAIRHGTFNRKQEHEKALTTIENLKDQLKLAESMHFLLTLSEPKDIAKAFRSFINGQA